MNWTSSNKPNKVWSSPTLLFEWNDILNIFPYLIIKRKIGDVNGTWTLEYCGVEPSYITIRTYGKPIIFFFLFVVIVISTVNKNKKKNFFFFRESTFIAVTFSRLSRAG